MAEPDSGVGVVLLVRSLTIAAGVGITAGLVALWIARVNRSDALDATQAIWLGVGTGLLAFGLSLPRR